METNTERELLIRIDERQKSMNESIIRIESNMSSKVDNNQDYKDMVLRVSTMWDLKNRTMGYASALSAVIAVAATLIIEYIRSLFVK